MKNEIFIQYVDAIAKTFQVTREELISNSRKKDHVEARQVLYYLCSKRNMRLTQIQKFMAGEGYDPGHCTIHRGIKAISKRVREDYDYKTVTERIENSIFI